jgi:ribonuclease BN (tRNA processing enzyme)
MKLTFLGSGSYFTTDNFHSNIIIEKDGKRLLVDCGSDIKFSLQYNIVNKTDDTITLKKTGLTANDIDAVYISHLHGDHVGGLEYLAFASYPWDGKPKEKIKLFCDEKMMEELWETTLKGGLQALDGQTRQLSDYFDIQPISTSNNFMWNGTLFTSVNLLHMNGNKEGLKDFVSNGLLFISEKGKKIFITTDAKFSSKGHAALYRWADLIFNDCETLPEEFKSGVHAHYSELKTLNSVTKKKMKLYHYQTGPKPDCIKDGFAGWVQQGEVFDV